MEDIPADIKNLILRLIHSRTTPNTLQWLQNSHSIATEKTERPVLCGNTDGLACLASEAFIKYIFPEDLRSVTARELLNTSLPVSSASMGLTRDMVNTITQLMVEEKFIEVSKRTISKLFGRGLATIGSGTMSPIVEKFTVPKLDLSLSLEQGTV